MTHSQRFYSVELWRWHSALGSTFNCGSVIVPCMPYGLLCTLTQCDMVAAKGMLWMRRQGTGAPVCTWCSGSFPCCPAFSVRSCAVSTQVGLAIRLGCAVRTAFCCAALCRAGPCCAMMCFAALCVAALCQALLLLAWLSHAVLPCARAVPIWLACCFQAVSCQVCALGSCLFCSPAKRIETSQTFKFPRPCLVFLSFHPGYDL